MGKVVSKGAQLGAKLLDFQGMGIGPKWSQMLNKRVGEQLYKSKATREFGYAPELSGQEKANRKLLRNLDAATAGARNLLVYPGGSLIGRGG